METSNRKSVNEIDRFVGDQLRKKRLLKGLTQTELAKVLGITSQQLQKYETGLNRISAGRLYCASRVLGCSVSHFFEGYEDNTELTDHAMTSDRMLLRLSQQFRALDNNKIQSTILDLVSTISKSAA